MSRAVHVLVLGALLGGVVTAGSTGAIRVRDAAAEAGLEFIHENGAAGQFHLPEIMGAGGALLDYDRDGDLDVVLVQGGSLQREVHTGPRVFRNDLEAVGRVRFTDVTSESGFATGMIGMGVAAGDYDNDGYPDLYFTNLGPNRLYRNTGRGRFTDVTSRAGPGVDDPRWSTSASFTDYDGDGHLDLFVANYVDYSPADNKVCSNPAGRRDYCGPLQFRPARDRLFRNNGKGTFADVTEPAGLTTADGAGLGVSGADFNGDGRIDFYVANDAGANQLWLNMGNGTFEDGALLAGVAFTADGVPEGSMGIAAGDPDNDGDVDIVVTNITGESHAFYVNRGGGVFEDRRLGTGIGPATRRFTGFGADWFDADNDGLLDLFIANGAVTILEALRGDIVPFRQRNQLLRNEGERFRDITSEAGSGLEPVETSRGVSFGDVDNDGDEDLLVTNNAGPVRLLVNESPGGLNWLQVRLEGVTDNRQGLGARVGVTTGDGRTLWRRARTDGSYLSSSDARVHVGLGRVKGTVDVTVEWPSGARETWEGVTPDQMVTLRQGSGKKH